MVFIVEVRPVEAGAEVRGVCGVVHAVEVFERER